jgi:hypothetical protein
LVGGEVECGPLRTSAPKNKRLLAFKSHSERNARFDFRFERLAKNRTVGIFRSGPEIK